MTQISTFIGGIDIAKEKLDAAVHGMPGGIVVENAEAGWEQLAQFFKQAGVGKVGVEATGGYERRVVRYLQRAGFDVVVLQPNQVRAFAKMRLQRAKNDRIDAHLIAACTYVLDARARAPRDERFDELADHLTFIEQIESDATRIKTRLEHIGDRRQRGIYARMIKRLETLAKAERLRLMKHLAVHPDLVRRVELVSSIPGWPSLSGCPSSARSAARRSPRSRVWRRLFIKVASIKARCISAAAASRCGGRSTKLFYRQPPFGTRLLWRSRSG